MTDSPINFMMEGHTASYLESQEMKNRLLKDKLASILSQLTLQKEDNIKYLKQIDNQEETIRNVKEEVETLQKRKLSQTFNALNLSKELNEKERSASSTKLDLRYRVNSKSTELPNKKVYLDKNNKSIESSFQSQIFQKKLKMEPKAVKKITSYGNLYAKKSFSVKKPGVK